MRLSKDAVIVGRDDLGDNLLILGEDLAELCKHLLRVLPALSEDGGVGGDAINGKKRDKLPNGLDIGAINEELHDDFLSFEVRVPCVPFVWCFCPRLTYSTCSVRSMMSSCVALESTLKNALYPATRTMRSLCASG